MEGELDIYPEDFQQTPEEFYLLLYQLHQTHHLNDLSELYNYCEAEQPHFSMSVKNFAQDFKIKL